MEVNAKILVTGATGSNGREIIRQLTVRGIAVRAYVRQAGRIRWETPLAEEAEGDLDDTASLERAMHGIEKVFVITGLSETVVNWIANVIAVAGRARIRHLVRLSALGADRRSPCQILRQHGEADAMVIASGRVYTILRPSAFFQNLLDSAAMIESSSRFVSAVGNGRQSLVDGRDLAEAAVRVLTEPNHEWRIYALTGPEALSPRDLARELTSLLGRPIVYQHVTPKEVEQAMLTADASPWLAHAVAELQAAFATDAFAEPTPALGDLLARPARRFADFARENANAFR